MGMITDAMRYRQLRGQRMDLNFKIQQIVSEKAELTKSGNDLMRVGTDYDPDSPTMKMLKKRQEDLKILEERLDQQMHEYQTDLAMVEAEINSCKDRLYSEIQSEMSYK